MSATLRALRSLATEAQSNARQAEDRADAFTAFLAYEAACGLARAAEFARDHATHERPAVRQAFLDIVAILERPAVEVVR